MSNLTLFCLSCFTTTFLYLVLGLIILIKAKNRRLGKVLFFYYLNISLWSGGLGFEVISATKDVSLFWAKLLHIGVIFLSVAYLHFVLIFTGSIKTKKLFLNIAYLLGTLLSWAVLKGWIVKDVSQKLYFHYYTEPGVLYPLLIIFFILCFSFAFCEFIIDYKKASIFRKNQIGYFFISAIIGYIAGSSTYLPVFNMPVWPLSMLFVCLHPLLVAYAIIGYRLLGIRVVLRSVLPPIITVVIFGAVLISLLRHFPILSTRLYNVADLVTFLVLSIMFQAGLYFIIARYLNKFFPQKNYAHLLYEFQRNLGICHCAEQVFSHAMDVLKEKDGPRPKSALFLWQKNGTQPFSVSASFGIAQGEHLQLLQDASLIQFVQKEYVQKKEQSDIAPILIKDALGKAYQSYELDGVLKDLGSIQSFVCIPLMVQTQEKEKSLLGFLCLGEPEATDVYDKEDYAFFRDVAILTAQALVQVEARELVFCGRQQAYQAQLVDASFKIMEMQGVKELVVNSVPMIKNAINTLYAALYVYDPDTGMYTCQSKEEKDTHTVLCDPIHKEEYFIRFLQERKQPVAYKDLRMWADQSLSSDMQSAVDRAQAIHAELIIPVGRARLLGFIVLGKKKDAQDYSQADWNTFTLLANIIYMVLEKIILWNEAVREPVTKLYNHGFFQESLLQAVQQAIREKQWLSVLFFDIDFFKKYNDTYGHSQGDSILRTFAGFLQRESRSSDVVARVGGEEFGIILLKTDLEEAIRIAERMRQTMKKERILSAITVSIGVVSLGIDKDADPKETAYDAKGTRTFLYQSADAQMYHAKQAGRDCIRSTDPFLPIRLEGANRVKIVKVLVIEDESYLRHNVEHFLQVKGYQTFGAGTAGEGIDMYTKEKPDVILLDIGLPDKDGREVLTMIRKEDDKTLIGIITGDGDFKKEVLELGANKFFLKPLEHEDIGRWISDQVERRC